MPPRKSGAGRSRARGKKAGSKLGRFAAGKTKYSIKPIVMNELGQRVSRRRRPQGSGISRDLPTRQHGKAFPFKMVKPSASRKWWA